MRNAPKTLPLTPPPCGVLAPVSGGEKWVIALAVVTNCPPETGWTSEAEGVDYTFSIPPLPLRPLSRVASDYSSDSVVCIGSSASFASFA